MNTEPEKCICCGEMAVLPFFYANEEIAGMTCHSCYTDFDIK